jgi:hypothetical protein
VAAAALLAITELPALAALVAVDKVILLRTVQVEQLTRAAAAVLAVAQTMAQLLFLAATAAQVLSSSVTLPR